MVDSFDSKNCVIPIEFVEVVAFCFLSFALWMRASYSGHMGVKVGHKLLSEQ